MANDAVTDIQTACGAGPYGTQGQPTPSRSHRDRIAAGDLPTVRCRGVKKRAGARRAVTLLPPSDLEAMSTKQLLGRLARLRFCEHTAAACDMTATEIGASTGILFKDTPEWRDAIEAVKAVLSRREHVRRRTRPG
jgi:hypothetical protein